MSALGPGTQDGQYGSTDLSRVHDCVQVPHLLLNLTAQDLCTRTDGNRKALVRDQVSHSHHCCKTRSSTKTMRVTHTLRAHLLCCMQVLHLLLKELKELCTRTARDKTASVFGQVCHLMSAGTVSYAQGLICITKCR